jgi:hypothetical protein
MQFFKIDNVLHEHKNQIKFFLIFIMNTYGLSFNYGKLNTKIAVFLL